MTSRYRVEYALKSHRRDEFIEWIKGLLAVPFVLHADVENYDQDISQFYHDPVKYENFLENHELEIASECQKRYLEIFADVEKLIDHTILLDKLGDSDPKYVSSSRLRRLVPSVGKFFTRLPLQKAFLIEDQRKQISKRRLVSPSFNDVRSILNTAQILSLSRMYKNGDVSGSKLKLITFDGDVTLYDDGKSLTEDAPVVRRLIKLLSLDIFVGVVTAAGYPGQQGVPQYYERLKGLIDAINKSTTLADHQKENLLVMGGESNYLFRYDNNFKNLRFIDGDEWYLPITKKWDKARINEIMDIIDRHLNHVRKKFNLDKKDVTQIIRKERSIGIIPLNGYKISREHLEEMVLSCSLKLNETLSRTCNDPLAVQLRNNPHTRRTSIITKSQHTREENEEDEARHTVRDNNYNENLNKINNGCTSLDINQNKEADDIKVCAFNGGQDVWVDIGDKSLGVESLQKYLCKDEKFNHICPIIKSESLHIGDQFASLGANDFKARLSACTVWITSPSETVAILDDLLNEII